MSRLVRVLHEDAELALGKLARKDSDLVDIGGTRLDLTFGAAEAAALTVHARIEPVVLSRVPSVFPRHRAVESFQPPRRFYAYTWDQVRGTLEIDGKLDGEAFFVELTTPGSGHPQAFTHGWLRNDDDNLYAVLDFVSDNTSAWSSTVP